MPGGRQIAVTGATGFIGALLVKQLVARGDSVRVLVRAPTMRADFPRSVRVFQGDLVSEPGNLAEFVDGADVLYHLAGEVRHVPAMRALHVEGTRALLKAAAGRVAHWVQMSSVAVYGPLRSGFVDEDWPLAPQREYEATKAEAERLVRMAAAGGTLTCTVVRPSTVFGPGMPNRSLRQLVSAVARGLFFFVGPPGALANYIYVDNVVDALIACGVHPAAKGGTYNLSDDRTMEEFVGTIAECVGRPAPRVRLAEAPIRLLARALGRIPNSPLTESRVDALTARVRYSTRRIEAELGYRHAVSMTEAIHRYIASEAV
ncbi:MAG: NAD-dependent epimerase/dehydratase family protein [Pseudomonadota bacterium]|jgi:nucleoside-diphosphate-sugar epimerase